MVTLLITRAALKQTVTAVLIIVAAEIKKYDDHTYSKVS
jgi:hypothetical protein